MARLFLLGSLLAVLAGCQLLSPHPAQTPPAEQPAQYTGPAQVRSQIPSKVQTLRVEAEVRSKRVEPELPPEPPPADPLSLAAECLEQGNDEGAAAQLGRHIKNHPDHVIFRAQLAEILTRLNRLSEAQAHFEAVAEQSQQGPQGRERLVHYHTRLMEIARQRADDYSEHLHQGIGLYLVATQLAEKGEADDAERLLCKAAGALKEAETLRPDEARPPWYLYLLWSQLGQSRPAERALAKAASAAPFSSLTTAEARAITLANHSPSLLK